MTVRNPGRPTSAEQIAYFRQYIDLVPDGDIIDILTRQIVETTAFFSSFTLEQAQWRPEAGEWSTVEIAGHVADTERVLTYRALRIARADPVLWESIEFEPYVEHGGFGGRELASVVEEFAFVRGATVTLLRGLGEEAWGRRMPEEWSCRSVRSLAYVIAGHELHHVEGLRQVLG